MNISSNTSPKIIIFISGEREIQGNFVGIYYFISLQNVAAVSRPERQHIYNSSWKLALLHFPKGDAVVSLKQEQSSQ